MRGEDHSTTLPSSSIQFSHHQQQSAEYVSNNSYRQPQHQQRTYGQQQHDYVSSHQLGDSDCSNYTDINHYNNSNHHRVHPPPSADSETDDDDDVASYVEQHATFDARPLLPKAAFFMGDLRDGLPMVRFLEYNIH